MSHTELSNFFNNPQVVTANFENMQNKRERCLLFHLDGLVNFKQKRK